MKLIKNFLLGLNFILLAACVPQQILKPVANPSQTWQHYVEQVNAIEHWQASGLIGIRDGDQAVSADFNWKQIGDQFVISLSGPLNLGEEILQGRPGQISLTKSQGQVLKADNAEDLMQQELGWSMPVEGLVYWIRALPVANMPKQITLSNNGTLASLRQQNWNIRYESYDVIDGLPFPHKIIMQQGPWRIVVVVNDWQAN